MITRRRFLKKSLAATLPLSGIVGAGAWAAAADIQRAAKPLDILVLGGTGFIGPNQIEYALARGHRVTMFNRGRTAADMYGDRVETLLGNRDDRIDTGLRSLQGMRRWDAVIDNSGYVPRHVRDSALLLKGRVGRYLYISSTAAYDQAYDGSVDEKVPLIKLTDFSDEQRTGASYGPFKAASDQIVQDVYGGAATIIRPTFIVGPGDESDRFTYWVDRVAAGGDVLGPPFPDNEMRWVDVRDLCPWIISLLERDIGGAFNASAPATPTTWRAGLNVMATLAASPVRFHWPQESVLRELKINLPIAMFGGPERRILSDAAQAAGLHYRPLLDTSRDILTWWQRQTPERRASVASWPSRTAEQEAIARSQRA